MHYHIDTIPIWDAYKAGSECPLCELARKCEAEYVELFLGASVMEPSRRVEVNDKGFCARHFSQLYAQQNRLGLALMAHTHTQQLRGRTGELMQAAVASAQQEGGRALPAQLMGKALKNSPSRGKLSDIAAQIGALTRRCALCDTQQNTMERYARTLIQMWRKEPSFQAAFAQSKGVCLPHFAQLLTCAGEDLSGREQAEFVKALCDTTEGALARIEGQLQWFTEKFDYRNREKPWNGAEDSIERALRKLAGPEV